MKAEPLSFILIIDHLNLTFCKIGQNQAKMKLKLRSIQSEERRKFCDCSLMSEGESIDCHCAVLASMSPVISDALRLIKSKGLGEKYRMWPVLLNNISFKNLQLIVELAYENEVKVDTNSLPKFLETLGFLKVEFLLQEPCCEHLKLNSAKKNTSVKVFAPVPAQNLSFDLRKNRSSSCSAFVLKERKLKGVTPKQRKYAKKLIPQTILLSTILEDSWEIQHEAFEEDSKEIIKLTRISENKEN